MAAKKKQDETENDAQKAMREYHEGDFQKKDPITGEARDLDAPKPVARVDRGETVEDVLKDAEK